jgi:hypothetical protein
VLLFHNMKDRINNVLVGAGLSSGKRRKRRDPPDGPSAYNPLPAAPDYVHYLSMPTLFGGRPPVSRFGTSVEGCLIQSGAFASYIAERMDPSPLLDPEGGLGEPKKREEDVETLLSERTAYTDKSDNALYSYIKRIQEKQTLLRPPVPETVESTSLHDDDDDEEGTIAHIPPLAPLLVSIDEDLPPVPVTTALCTPVLRKKSRNRRALHSHLSCFATAAAEAEPSSPVASLEQEEDPPSPTPSLHASDSDSILAPPQSDCVMHAEKVLPLSQRRLSPRRSQSRSQSRPGRVRVASPRKPKYPPPLSPAPSLDNSTLESLVFHNEEEEMELPFDETNDGEHIEVVFVEEDFPPPNTKMDRYHRYGESDATVFTAAWQEPALELTPSHLKTMRKISIIDHHHGTTTEEDSTFRFDERDAPEKQRPVLSPHPQSRQPASPMVETTREPQSGEEHNVEEESSSSNSDYFDTYKDDSLVSHESQGSTSHGEGSRTVRGGVSPSLEGTPAFHEEEGEEITLEEGDSIPSDGQDSREEEEEESPAPHEVQPNPGFSMQNSTEDLSHLPRVQITEEGSHFVSPKSQDRLSALDVATPLATNVKHECDRSIIEISRSNEEMPESEAVKEQVSRDMFSVINDPLSVKTRNSRSHPKTSTRVKKLMALVDCASPMSASPEKMLTGTQFEPLDKMMIKVAHRGDVGRPIATVKSSDRPEKASPQSPKKSTASRSVTTGYGSQPQVQVDVRSTQVELQMVNRKPKSASTGQREKESLALHRVGDSDCNSILEAGNSILETDIPGQSFAGTTPNGSHAKPGAKETIAVSPTRSRTKDNPQDFQGASSLRADTAVTGAKTSESNLSIVQSMGEQDMKLSRGRGTDLTRERKRRERAVSPLTVERNSSSRESKCGLESSDGPPRIIEILKDDDSSDGGDSDPVSMAPQYRTASIMTQLSSIPSAIGDQLGGGSGWDVSSIARRSHVSSYDKSNAHPPKHSSTGEEKRRGALPREVATDVVSVSMQSCVTSASNYYDGDDGGGMQKRGRTVSRTTYIRRTQSSVSRASQAENNDHDFAAVVNDRTDNIAGHGGKATAGNSERLTYLRNALQSERSKIMEKVSSLIPAPPIQGSDGNMDRAMQSVFNEAGLILFQPTINLYGTDRLPHGLEQEVSSSSRSLNTNGPDIINLTEECENRKKAEARNAVKHPKLSGEQTKRRVEVATVSSVVSSSDERDKVTRSKGPSVKISFPPTAGEAVSPYDLTAMPSMQGSECASSRFSASFTRTPADQDKTTSSKPPLTSAGGYRETKSYQGQQRSTRLQQKNPLHRTVGATEPLQYAQSQLSEDSVLTSQPLSSIDSSVTKPVPSRTRRPLIQKLPSWSEDEQLGPSTSRPRVPTNRHEAVSRITEFCPPIPCDRHEATSKIGEFCARTGEGISEAVRRRLPPDKLPTKRLGRANQEEDDDGMEAELRDLEVSEQHLRRELELVHRQAELRREHLKKTRIGKKDMQGDTYADCLWSVGLTSPLANRQIGHGLVATSFSTTHQSVDDDLTDRNLSYGDGDEDTTVSIFSRRPHRGMLSQQTAPEFLSKSNRSEIKRNGGQRISAATRYTGLRSNSDSSDDVEVIFVEESFLSTNSFSFGETKAAAFSSSPKPSQEPYTRMDYSNPRRAPYQTSASAPTSQILSSEDGSVQDQPQAIQYGVQHQKARRSSHPLEIISLVSSDESCQTAGGSRWSASKRKQQFKDLEIPSLAVNSDTSHPPRALETQPTQNTIQTGSAIPDRVMDFELTEQPTSKKPAAASEEVTQLPAIEIIMMESHRFPDMVVDDPKAASGDEGRTSDESTALSYTSSRTSLRSSSQESDALQSEGKSATPQPPSSFFKTSGKNLSHSPSRPRVTFLLPEAEDDQESEYSSSSSESSRISKSGGKVDVIDLRDYDDSTFDSKSGTTSQAATNSAELDLVDVTDMYEDDEDAVINTIPLAGTAFVNEFDENVQDEHTYTDQSGTLMSDTVTDSLSSRVQRLIQKAKENRASSNESYESRSTLTFLIPDSLSESQTREAERDSSPNAACRDNDDFLKVLKETIAPDFSTANHHSAANRIPARVMLARPPAQDQGSLSTITMLPPHAGYNHATQAAATSSPTKNVARKGLSYPDLRTIAPGMGPSATGPRGEMTIHLLKSDDSSSVTMDFPDSLNDTLLPQKAMARPAPPTESPAPKSVTRLQKLMSKGRRLMGPKQPAPSSSRRSLDTALSHQRNLNETWSVEGEPTRHSLDSMSTSLDFQYSMSPRESFENDSPRADGSPNKANEDRRKTRERRLQRVRKINRSFLPRNKAAAESPLHEDATPTTKAETSGQVFEDRFAEVKRRVQEMRGSPAGG